MQMQIIIRFFALLFPITRNSYVFTYEFNYILISFDIPFIFINTPNVEQNFILLSCGCSFNSFCFLHPSVWKLFSTIYVVIYILSSRLLTKLESFFL